jgi:nucleoside-diphosphate-sugar epimerase
VAFILISNYITGIAVLNNTPILVTGAAGNVGSVGRDVVKLLREHDLPVRALVHLLDERSQVLSEMGAELVIADLTNGADVVMDQKSSYNFPILIGRCWI